MRIAPSGRAVGGLVLFVVLAVVTAMVALWLARPREQQVPSRAPTVGAPLSAGGGASDLTGGLAGSGTTGATDPAAARSAGTAVAGTLLVHVVGAIRDPGVVELPPGSRVTDAIEAAGGVTRRAATASVNLARPVLDGEQVVVLRRGAPAAVFAPGVGAAAGAPGEAGPAPEPVDLNSATLDTLDALPGIGPVLAQRILDWRTTNGRFSTVEELGEVSGIGEATLGDLRALVRV